VNNRPYDHSDTPRTDPVTDVTITSEYIEEEDGDEKTERLVVEIEQTRADLSGTIDAIQERLSPQTLKEEAKSLITDATGAVKDEAKSLMSDATDAVREATIGKVERMATTATHAAKEKGNSVFDMIVANPIPSALVGIGLSWLFMNRKSSSSSNYYEMDRSNRYATGYSGAYEPYDEDMDLERSGRGIAGNVTHGAGKMAGKVSGTAGNVTGMVTDTAGSVADSVTDAASDVAEIAGNLTGQAKQKTSQALHSTQRRVSQIPDQVQDMVQSTPLMVAGTAIALGAAIGLVLPESAAEHRTLGNARDRFMDQTRGMVKETTEKVQHVAEDVAQSAQDTMKERAREEHLTA